MVNLSYQPWVDIKHQLTVVQASCQHQLMVESQNIRDAFATRLNKALDGATGIRPGRGRNTDLHAELSKLGVSATKQATHKWLAGASIPERSHIEKLAKWLDVRTEWLEYGHGEMKETAHSAPSSADIVRKMLEKHGRSLSADARRKIVDAVEAEAPKQAAQQSSNVINADFSRIQPRKGELLVPQYDIRAAMGAGQLPPDYIETVRNLVVNEAHLRAHGVDYTAPENLAMITGWGQSMLGTINDKDPVMVDKGINEFIGEGIYVLTWHEHMYIKRVQMLDAEHFQLISDNSKYPNQQARVEDVIFHAKVLLIWNAKKA